MLKEKMIELEDNLLQHKFNQNSIFQEYEDIITNLKEELTNCKIEQNKLRLEIEALRNENKIASDTFYRTYKESNENCNKVAYDETMTNLEKRITILQMEKDSVYQLWQISLKAIDVLEDELKTVYTKDTSSNICNEQINNIKETYSEAITILESKLVSAKENFFQHQMQWQQSTEKIDQLTIEKNNIIHQLNVSQEQALEKDKSNHRIIDSLQENLKHCKNELEQMQQSKLDLEEKLKKVQKFANDLLAKDNEAKNKVSEAVDLIETAVKEKDAVLKREARLVDEKTKIESCFIKLSEEYTSRLETEIMKSKEIYTKNIKKHLIEIKELKSELREQGTLLNRSQREYRLAEEELEKIRHGTDNFIQKSSFRFLSAEQALQEKNLYDDRIYSLERQISNLQEKLSSTNEKLKIVHVQSSRDMEEHMMEADHRTREIMEKCLKFERQLSRALTDKETLTTNLHLLEVSFEKEMQKRNLEKMYLENKVQDLQEKVANANGTADISKSFLDSMINKKYIEKETFMNSDSISNILALQEKFDKKTKELTQHVETHQKLSNKWKEEASLLTSKFQKRTQELKTKIIALQKQNDELSREMLFYQKLLAQCNSQKIDNCKRDTEIR